MYHFDKKDVTIAYKSGKRGCWKNNTTVDVWGNKDQLSKVEQIIKTVGFDWLKNKKSPTNS